MTIVCKRFYISGKVQGVFYRDSTQKKATELHLSGWVKNLSDGRVEVLACGVQERLDRLEEWLWQGPSDAVVDDIIIVDDEKEEHTYFVVMRE